MQAVCTTGAQTLNSINNLESGILICGCRFIDMMYTEIYEYLPSEFQMLLIASASSIQEREISNIVSLVLPMKVHELLQTVEMMEEKSAAGVNACGNARRYVLRRIRRSSRKPRSLMDRNGFSEEEAHRYIQKRSMDNGTELVEVSQMILSLMQEG